MKNKSPKRVVPRPWRRACVAGLLLALAIGTGCSGSADVAAYTFNMPAMFEQTIPPDPAVDVAGISPAQTTVNANPGGGGGGGGPLVYGDPLDDQFQAGFDPYNPPPEQQDPPPSDFWP